eukprot:scaffold326293_cov58-Tisochrysis_lutea.AAC.1
MHADVTTNQASSCWPLRPVSSRASCQADRGARRGGEQAGRVGRPMIGRARRGGCMYWLTAAAPREVIAPRQSVRGAPRRAGDR